MDIITAKTDRFFLLRYAANSLCNNALATAGCQPGHDVRNIFLPQYMPLHVHCF